MNISRLQSGLVKWFIINENKPQSLSSVQNTCLNLCENETGEPIISNWKALSLTLFPLLRCGIIEFNGNNGFMLSPSCAINQNSFILVCNVPETVLTNFKTDILFDTHLGIQVYRESSELAATLFRSSISITPFHFSNNLACFPSIDQVITSWKDNVVVDNRNFQFLTEQIKWSNNSNPPAQGVFKKSSEVYAERVIKLSSNSWKSIPMRQYHFDSNNIAVTWNQIKNADILNIEYSKSQNKIIIKSNYFPILIERLLVLNTLLTMHDPENIFKREYFLTSSDFRFLSCLFENKIELI